MRPFDPLFASPHAQTIAGHFWKRRCDMRRFPAETELHCTEPGVRVLVESQRPAGAAAAEIVLVHGLEGSGEAGYMQGMSDRALQAGFAAHRFHMRTCGGTERLSPTLYHGGLTSDLLAVLREFERQGRAPVYLIGFSLGGNVVLKLAGELGEDAAKWIAGVCAVSTPIDLSASCRHINRPENWVYQQRFVRKMRDRLCATGRYTREQFRDLRSILAIDDRITAPAFGFRDAEHYYATQSCNQFLQRIHVPALLIQAKDDTLVPFEIFDHPAFERNPNLRLIATEHGGHLGFISRTPPRFWAEETAVEWIMEQVNRRI